MSFRGGGTWGGTGDALSRYLEPPGRPDTFIQLSQSGKNFLTSDKYMDGAKRRHFKEAPQPIALGEVNYGIFKKPTAAPREGAHIYDKEEVVLPGAIVVPGSWRPVPAPELANPFMMTPVQRRLILKQQRSETEARRHNRGIEQSVVRREYLMRNAYPHGVMGASLHNTRQRGQCAWSVGQAGGGPFVSALWQRGRWRWAVGPQGWGSGSRLVCFALASS